MRGNYAMNNKQAVSKTVKRLNAIPANIKKAQDRALNRAARQTKTKVSSLVREAVPLKKSYVDPKIEVKIIDIGDGSKQATISSVKRGMLLSRFPYKKLKRRGKGAGIQVQTSKGNRTIFKHAFLIPLLAGKEQGNNVGIAVRVGPDYKRTPVDVLHGLSISQLFRHHLPMLKEEAAKLYNLELKRQLKYALQSE